MSWKINRFNHHKNRGKETQVSMNLLSDTHAYRVTARVRVTGEMWETTHDSIAEHDESFLVFQSLIAEAVTEEFQFPENHPLLQSVNPAAQAAIDNAYRTDLPVVMS